MLILSACNFESEAQKVVRSYIDAIAVEDTQKALSYIDIDPKLGTTETKIYQGKIKVVISSVSAMIKAKGGIKELKLNKEQKLDDQIVEVEFEIIFNDGSNEKDKLKLIKRANGYKIVM